MPNNTDIYFTLNEDMKFESVLRDGRSLYTRPALGNKDTAVYLYRSMPLQEAKDWFVDGWLPDDSGIPWSTNPEYSKTYLTGNVTVQLEVPAHDVMDRLKAVGATPKIEGDGETWGTGPKSETGRSGSGEANKKLQALHSEYAAKLPPEFRDLKSGAVINTKNAKFVQNSLFRTMFKDKMPQARVVSRIFD